MWRCLEHQRNAGDFAVGAADTRTEGSGDSGTEHRKNKQEGENQTFNILGI